MNKNILKSKTFWLGILTALAPLIPGVGTWVTANLETVGVIWGGLTVLLRFITKDKVVLIG